MYSFLLSDILMFKKTVSFFFFSLSGKRIKYLVIEVYSIVDFFYSLFFYVMKLIYYICFSFF